MACGRGGDLFKFIDAEIKYVYGGDLSAVEISEARDRYARNKTNPKYKQIARRVDFKEYTLMKANFADPIDPMLDLDGTFDAVNCQFALHFFFMKGTSAETLMRRVSQRLKPGGYFFGMLFIYIHTFHNNIYILLYCKLLLYYLYFIYAIVLFFIHYYYSYYPILFFYLVLQSLFCSCGYFLCLMI